MTIEYRKGNLLDVTEGIIVHGCNAQGVMGSGVALSIKNKYPEVYKDYKQYIGYRDAEDIHLGDTVWTKIYNDTLFVVSAITQWNYGKSERMVNYASIVNVFQSVINDSNWKGLELPLHFPKIGAGLGGGDWSIIEQLINDCDPEDRVTKICWEL